MALLLRMKLDGEKYEIDADKLTLGEARLLKDQFSVADISDLNFFDADHITGLFAVAMRRAHPDMTLADVLKGVETIETGPIFEDINKQIAAAVAKQQKEEADPQPAAGKGSAAASDDGSSATPRTKRGSRSTRKS